MAADVNGTPPADTGEGVSLRDAIEQFSDPEKWQTYAAASSAAAGRRRARLFFFDEEPIAGWAAYDRAQAGNRLIDAAERAWHALYADFLPRLQSGELIATGFKVPVDPAIGRQVIPTDLWTVLQPNFRNSSARGGGCEFVGILVSRRPFSAPFEALPVKRDANEERAPSFPGRPSVMAAIEQEMAPPSRSGSAGEDIDRGVQTSGPMGKERI